jgi:hypothetical protein
MSADQWSDLLRAGFQEARRNEKPLVALLHGWYTGDADQYDYWQSFVSFLDEVQTQAAFVTTLELVELYSD